MSQDQMVTWWVEITFYTGAKYKQLQRPAVPEVQDHLESLQW